MNDTWDVDLMDMTKFARYNNGVHYIAIFIDIFSRYLYAEPMKNKMTKTTLQAIKRVFSRSKGLPNTFRSDAGNEFAGKEVQSVFSRQRDLSTINKKSNESQLC